MTTSTGSRRVCIAGLLVAFCLGACRGKDDDERPRRRPSESKGGGGGGVKPLFGSCPFGVCGGSSGGDDPASVCDRMRELSEKIGDAGFAPKPDDLASCERDLTEMQKTKPGDYSVLATCSREARDMDTLMSCMMKAYMADAGVPPPK